MTWETVSLGYLVQFGNGQDAQNVIEADGNYPVFGSGGCFARTNEYLYDGEVVLFGRKGTVDRPHYVNGRFWTIDTAYYAVSRGRIVPKFLYYWATTIPFERLMTNTARPSMTSANLSRLPVNLPPLDEQLRIADYLDQETTLMDALSDQLEALRISLKARLDEFRRSQLRGPLTLLSVAARMRTGFTPKGFEAIDLEAEDAVPWVKPGDLGLGNVSAALALPRASVSSTDIFPARTPLVVGIGATLGKCGRFDHAVCANQQITALLPNPGLSNDYLFHAIASLTDELRSTAQQSTLPITSNARLGTYRVPLPHVDEQRRIVSRLDEETARTDAMIEDARKLQRLIAERRSALITEVVSGRKEI